MIWGFTFQGIKKGIQNKMAKEFEPSVSSGFYISCRSVVVPPPPRCPDPRGAPDLGGRLLCCCRFVVFASVVIRTPRLVAERGAPDMGGY